jgi:hypothetical protein
MEVTVRAGVERGEVGMEREVCWEGVLDGQQGTSQILLIVVIL